MTLSNGISWMHALSHPKRFFRGKSEMLCYSRGLR